MIRRPVIGIKEALLSWHRLDGSDSVNERPRELARCGREPSDVTRFRVRSLPDAGGSNRNQEGGYIWGSEAIGITEAVLPLSRRWVNGRIVLPPIA
jgi:hypothetical protein